MERALDLKEIFSGLKDRKHAGVRGVVCIDSGKPGPTLGITACTHGNEPSGLVAIDRVIKLLRSAGLLHGRLYLVLNNLRATERYFAARSEDEERDARFCDLNMNRLPENVLSIGNDRVYEIQRVQELYPIWSEFTHGLDMHSTLTDLPPMIISRKDGLSDDLIRGIPIKTVLLNIDRVQIGVPAFAFYGGFNSSSSTFAIEAGSHKSPASFELAARTAITLLQNLEMIPGHINYPGMEYEEYYIEDSILYPDLSYHLPPHDELQDFDFVRAGTVLGYSDKGPDIVAPFDCHPIMMTPPNGEKALSEEVMFLSRPVKIRCVQ